MRKFFIFLKKFPNQANQKNLFSNYWNHAFRLKWHSILNWHLNIRKYWHMLLNANSIESTHTFLSYYTVYILVVWLFVVAIVVSFILFYSPFDVRLRTVLLIHKFIDISQSVNFLSYSSTMRTADGKLRKNISIHTYRIAVYCTL